MTTDIPVTYVNKTGDTEFEVLVFTQNYNPSTPSTVFAAWRVLRAQTQAKFVYPVKKMQVGATYELNGQTIMSGPFNATLGSTWNITQEPKDSTAVLAEGEAIDLCIIRWMKNSVLFSHPT